MTDQKRLSRRSFLKGAAVSTAGVAGTALLSGCSVGGTGGKIAGMPEKWDHEADIVVVGFGGAGAVAAMEAHDAKSKVLILEKMPEAQAGGATSCFGGILGISASYETLMVNSFGQLEEEYARKIAEYSAQVIPYFQGLGVEFVEGIPVAKDAGPAIYGALKNEVVGKRGIQVLYETPATALVQDPASKEIRGVQAEQNGATIFVKAKKAVILTSGDYAANNKMINNFNFPGVEFPTVGSPAATGEGILMGLEVGGQIWNIAMGFEFLEMGFKAAARELGTPITIHRANVYQPAPPLTDSRIFVNMAGQRFMNETRGLTHSKAPEAVLDFAGNLADSPHVYRNLPFFLVCDDTCIKSGPLGSPASMNWTWVRAQNIHAWSDDNSKEIEKGWVIKADTLEELAAKMIAKDWWGNDLAMDAAGLAATVEQYNAFCAAGEDTQFGKPKDFLEPILTPPFYAAELCPTVVYTIGGLKTDSDARTLNRYDQPIPRLYSAGNIGQTVVELPYGLDGCMACGQFAGRHAATLKAWD